MNECEDCGNIAFEYGDRVQLAQNRLVKGQVVGERNWDTEYNVRLIGLLKTEWFHNVELEPDEDFYGPAAAGDEGEDAPAVPAEDNVIYHDFKQAKVAGGVH